jgi:RND family efflux transporter MFP subunit
MVLASICQWAIEISQDHIKITIHTPYGFGISPLKMLFAMSCSKYPLIILLAVFAAIGSGWITPVVAQSSGSANAATGDEAKKPKVRTSLVGVDAVRLEPLSQTIPVIGRLVARQAGEVAAQVAGAIADMRVEVGDRVEKGQVLAVLDVASLNAELNEVEGELLQARAQLEFDRSDLRLAELGLKRQADLKKSGAFSKAKFEDWVQKVARANAGVARREAEISTTKASLLMKKINLIKATITAPYDGVVTQRMAETGSYVRVGDPVVYLISDRALEVEVDVPSLRVVGLKPGVKVTFDLDSGQRYEARVRAVLPSENPLTRTRMVRFEPDFSGNRERLADAQSVIVQIPVGDQRDIISVHKDAIIQRGDQNIVFVVTDEKAQSRIIELGEATGNRIEVLSGLKRGDQVVVRGNERLQGGAPVRIN